MTCWLVQFYYLDIVRQALDIVPVSVAHVWANDAVGAIDQARHVRPAYFVGHDIVATATPLHYVY